MLMQIDGSLIGGILQLGVPGVLSVVIYALWRHYEKETRRKAEEVDAYRLELKEQQLSFVAMLREQLTSYGLVISKMHSLPDEVSTKITANVDHMQKALYEALSNLPDQNAAKIEPIITAQVQIIKDTIREAK